MGDSVRWKAKDATCYKRLVELANERGTLPAVVRSVGFCGVEEATQSTEPFFKNSGRE